MSRNFSTLTLIVLLWIAGLCAAGQFAKIAVPFAEFRALYPDAGDSIGWLLSLISLVGAVLGLVAGALVNFFGARRVLLVGLLLGAALSFWQASLPEFTLFAASRVLEGVSHLAIVIAAPTLIAQASSDRYRGVAMAFWGTFFGVAFALVAWIGLPQVDVFGIRPLFVTHGVLMLLITAILIPFLRREDAARTATTPPQAPTIFLGLAKTFRSARIATPAVGWLFYTLTFVALLAILPGLLPVDERETIAGILPLLGIAVSLTLLPFLMRYVTASTAVMIGFGCAFLALFLTNSLPLLVVCLVLYSVLGLVQGGGFATVPELNRSTESRALSFGLLAQTGNIGNLCGTPLLLIVLDRMGEGGLILFVAGLYCCALVLLALLWRRYRREPES